MDDVEVDDDDEGGVDVDGLTFELVGPLLLLFVAIEGMGLSRPTSTTSIFVEEHFAKFESISLSLLVVRFCGDSDCCGGAEEFSDGGGSDVSGEFVAEALEEVVDVEDNELATDICGGIVAIVCGDMRDK